MGKKTKLRSNPTLAHAHQAGAKVHRLQVLTHAQYGAICYPAQRFWVLHANLAAAAHNRMRALDKKVLSTPPDKSKMRSLYGDALLQKIYAAGSEMVSNVVRSVQHIAYEMEQFSGSELSAATTLRRLDEASSRHGIALDVTDEGYQALVEMVGIRDAIEHPHVETVFTGDPNDWDKVPLAWMLSDRSVTAFARFRPWFERLAETWGSEIAAMPERAITLQVQRGIQSDLPVKQPPATKR